MKVTTDIYLIAAKRTPIASFGSELASLTATDLASEAIKAILQSAGVSGREVEETFLGNVCGAGIGQTPARQAALKAGISEKSPATTINKVCASGLKSIILATQALQLNQRKLVIAGGAESMSNIPYYDRAARWGVKFGDQKLIDGLAYDGLTDATEGVAMGVLAEKICKEKGISREAQDQYSIASYKRAQKAWEEKSFSDEVCSISISSKNGVILIDKDEECFKVNFDKVSQLKPAFDSEGTITAAKASTIKDGAAALLLSNSEGLEAISSKPIAKIIGYSETALAPAEFTLAPIEATKALLKTTGITLEEVDLFEINEAFAMVPLAFAEALNLGLDKINVNGGAVSLGHPIGCSGTRIVVTLVHALRARNMRYGIAAICNGGGGASAMLIEAL
ncbi:MAG: thiolase family protein [Flavobacteriaceae bacterium]